MSLNVSSTDFILHVPDDFSVSLNLLLINIRHQSNDPPYSHEMHIELCKGFSLARTIISSLTDRDLQL
jgi:hypothetical protein